MQRQGEPLDDLEPVQDAFDRLIREGVPVETAKLVAQNYRRHKPKINQDEQKIKINPNNYHRKWRSRQFIEDVFGWCEGNSGKIMAAIYLVAITFFLMGPHSEDRSAARPALPHLVRDPSTPSVRVDSGSSVAGESVPLDIPPIPAPMLTGVPKVVDGETIVVRGVKIRLEGIDAPERGQACNANGVPWQCGDTAAAWLARQIEGDMLACAPKGNDNSGRTLATCFVGSENLNNRIVRDGWALAFRRYTDQYAEAEGEAKRNGAGIWRGDFIPPSEWREERQPGGSSRHAASVPQRSFALAQVFLCWMVVSNPFPCAVEQDMARR